MLHGLAHITAIMHGKSRDSAVSVSSDSLRTAYFYCSLNILSETTLIFNHHLLKKLDTFSNRVYRFPKLS